MMDITKSREAFEAAFAKKRGLSIENVISMRHGDDYWDDNHLAAGMGIAWIFWKLSRESIEFELPKSGFYLGYESPEYMEKDDVIEACGTAGIRIKGNEKS
ncbi:hypothetical protein [Yersinia kristensenii]|uniref:hypothetical protein n=1 Tax=Yersinia kristensenii TaxID=28152 RepID=UPI00119E037B|nr:hypothetical protein [Yersinia kristensenii]